MNLKKIVLIGTMLLGAGIASAEEDRFAKYTNVLHDPLILKFQTSYKRPALESKVMQELAQREYAQQRDGIDFIKFDQKYAVEKNSEKVMPVKFFWYMSSNLVNVDLKTDQIVYDGIVIQGNKKFQEMNISALDKLRTMDPEGYNYVLFNTRKIRSDNGKFWMCSIKKDIHVPDEWMTFPLDMYVGALVHEATHAQLNEIIRIEEEIASKRDLIADIRTKASDYELFRQKWTIDEKIWINHYKERYGDSEGERILNTKFE